MGLGLGAHPATAQGRTGIPEIDSLPLHDWRTPGRPLSYPKALLLSAGIPGGGQFYGGHPVRGGFLMGLETVLVGLAVYTNFVDLPKWRDQFRDALDSADLRFQETIRFPERAAELEAERRRFVDLARDRFELGAKQADLANSQIAWAAGLHAYGLLDAVEIAYLSRQPPGETLSARKALLRGMLFPGGGQLYNHRYGKFGMLWMTLGASAVSAYSRQQVVDLLNERLRTARAEIAGGSGSAGEVDRLENDRTLYRKRRNQYFWGMALFYVYAMLDGMVDAALSDFDSPERFALEFGPGPGGALALEIKLPF